MKNLLLKQNIQVMVVESGKCTPSWNMNYLACSFQVEY